MQARRISRRVFVRRCAIGIAMAGLAQGCAPLRPAAPRRPGCQSNVGSGPDAAQQQSDLRAGRVDPEHQPVSDGTLDDRFPQSPVQFAGRSRFWSPARS